MTKFMSEVQDYALSNEHARSDRVLLTRRMFCFVKCKYVTSSSVQQPHVEFNFYELYVNNGIQRPLEL